MAKAAAKTRQAAIVASQKAGQSVLMRMAERYGVSHKNLYESLKATAFKGDVSDEQFMALLVVADQYQLNPFTREIYAFPDKTAGIVPVVGVDGWARIINEHPQYDGMDASYDDDSESYTVSIYRKDRKHPTTVTEYLSECKRNTGPWGTHPRRMLRHKAVIQCARLAFGFAGIYDQDEAEGILEAQQVKASPPAYDLPTKKGEPKQKEAEPEAVETETEAEEEMPWFADGDPRAEEVEA